MGYLKLFIEYGMISEEKFYEKAENSLYEKYGWKVLYSGRICNAC